MKITKVGFSNRYPVIKDFASLSTRTKSVYMNVCYVFIIYKFYLSPGKVQISNVFGHLGTRPACCKWWES